MHMRRWAMRPDQSGQSQILVAAGLGVVMITAALYSLQYAANTQMSEFKFSRQTELRTVLDEATKRDLYLYRNGSSCDPVSLDLKLARINLDGTLAPAGTLPANPLRQINISVNNNTYRVAFGSVTRIPWRKNTSAGDPSVSATSYNIGTSQDAVV